MSYTHTSELNKLQNNFQNLWLIKDEIIKIKQVISGKLTHLKNSYTELTKKNTKKMYLFCLDTFLFQYKTYSIEIENLDKQRILLNNRMYCDYYKLYNVIATYIKENIEDLEAEQVEIRTFTQYKELEPFHEYNLDDIKAMHASILVFIRHLQTKFETNENTIHNYNAKNHVGFSISNYLNTLEFENLLLKQQLGLYLNYIAFFHISQQKQLKRLLSKLQEFDTEIDNNLNDSKMCSIDDIENSEPIEDFFKIEPNNPISQFEPETKNIFFDQIHHENSTDKIPEKD